VKKFKLLTMMVSFVFLFIAQVYASDQVFSITGKQITNCFYGEGPTISTPTTSINCTAMITNIDSNTDNFCIRNADDNSLIVCSKKSGNLYGLSGYTLPPGNYYVLPGSPFNEQYNSVCTKNTYSTTITLKCSEQNTGQGNCASIYFKNDYLYLDLEDVIYNYDGEIYHFKMKLIYSGYDSNGYPYFTLIDLKY